MDAAVVLGVVGIGYAVMAQLRSPRLFYPCHGALFIGSALVVEGRYFLVSPRPGGATDVASLLLASGLVLGGILQFCLRHGR
jgi:hypothetical protein